MQQLISVEIETLILMILSCLSFAGKTCLSEDMHFYSKFKKYSESKQSFLRIGNSFSRIDFANMTPGRIDELIRESWSSDSPPDYSVWVNAIINDPDSPTNALRTTLNALSDENRSQIFARQFLEQFRHDIRNLK